MRNINRVVTCIDSNPRDNLGPRWTSTNSEDRFAISFIQSYNKVYSSIHSGSKKNNRVMAREVPMNGFGIADLVTISWDPGTNLSHNSCDLIKNKPTVRAFEFKLTDWRRGILQAHRYKFFSDAAILVIPDSKLDLACNYLETFKKINVGLWGYNIESGTITTILTPRPRKPVNQTYREKAVNRVIESTTLFLPTV